MIACCWQFFEDEQGQDLVEYTLLIFFVMFTVIGLAKNFSGSVAGVASATNSNLSLANSAIH
jgi:Flp pilus assembly pilin Flp